MSSGDGDARLHRADAVVVERDQQRIEDEARLVLGLHRQLPGLLAPGPGRAQRLLRRVDAGRHLDQLHQLRRQAEVQADDAVVAARAAGDLGDRQRRGVGGEDRVLRADLVELAEQLALDGELLEHRLDDEIGVGQVVERRRARQPPHHGVLVGGLILPRSTDLAKKPSVCFSARSSACLGHVVADGPEAGARRDDGDAGAHGAAGAAHGDGLDRFAHFSTKLRPISWRWTWLVPSQICVILASRISRSTR